MAKSSSSRWLRLVVYTITAALSVVCIALAINALVKANRDLNHARNEALVIAPARTRINTSFQNLKIAGAFLLVGEGLLGLTALFWILNLLFSISNSKSTHLATIYLWSFELVWTFASAIATLVIARNRSVTVNAFLVTGARIPDQVVRGIENTIHYNPAYWSHIYVRTFSILPWILLLFAAIALDLAITQALPTEVKGAERAAAAAEANESPEASPVTEKRPPEDEKNPRKDDKHAGDS